MRRVTFDVQLAPAMLGWARDRAHLSEEDLAQKIGASRDEIVDWERTGQIPVHVTEKIAAATYTPIGYLYLDEPPVDQLPIRDFRTVGDEAPRTPSPNLLAVLDDAQGRQDWYRDYLIANGSDPLGFVGTLARNTPTERGAHIIREHHELSGELRAQAATWEEALRLEIEKIEDSGVLVMRSGIVGNNTHRRLDVSEFRGFAIADPYVPLVFVNGRDAKAAQMFTLIHELVHIWIGASGVSNLERTLPPDNDIERFSNAVAAEILVPESEIRQAWAGVRGAPDATRQLTRRFKVSALVVLRRLYDIGAVDWETFRQRYIDEEERFRAAGERQDGGGDFYATQRSRTSRRFATALIESTLEGRTAWRDALQLMGIRKIATFKEMARRLGFNP